ncbi:MULTISPECIES: GNAT family N-acetyltransferase [Sphingomonas]|uniref:GNAT family N-acetyltransferase n=1 Tax=Sphingomonas TaxID=13687 RepID=UPI000DF01B2B|nr:MULTISPECIES: GNAT family N-acetyltransferase [Sphingomonas]
MRLEPATAADLPALERLVESAYRGDSARAGWSHEADLVGGRRTDAAELAAMLANPAQHILLRREGDALGACVAVTDKGEGLAYLGMLTVDPTAQASGTGRDVLAGAEAFARDTLGATRMEMQVIAQRPELIAWYERRGYRPTGETRPFPYDEQRYTPKRADLAFVVLEKTL